MEIRQKVKARINTRSTRATISSQWKAGAKWLFFMPWYDYRRTNDPASAAFNDQSHSSASISWWKDAFNCDFVLSREDVKY